MKKLKILFIFYAIVFMLTSISITVIGYPIFKNSLEKDTIPPYAKSNYDNYARCFYFFYNNNATIEDSHFMCNNYGVAFNESYSQYSDRIKIANPFISLSLFFGGFFIWMFVNMIILGTIKSKEQSVK